MDRRQRSDPQLLLRLHTLSVTRRNPGDDALVDGLRDAVVPVGHRRGDRDGVHQLLQMRRVSCDRLSPHEVPGSTARGLSGGTTVLDDVISNQIAERERLPGIQICTNLVALHLWNPLGHEGIEKEVWDAALPSRKADRENR